MKLNVSAACGWGVAAAAQAVLAYDCIRGGPWGGLVPLSAALFCAYRAGRDRTRVVLEPDAVSIRVGDKLVRVDP